MKKKILVLCGGISKERLISLETGRQVAKELRKNQYKVLTCEPDSTLLEKIKYFKPVDQINTITYWKLISSKFNILSDIGNTLLKEV